MPDLLAADAILLRSEDKNGKCGMVKVRKGCRGKVQTHSALVHFDIGQSKWVGFSVGDCVLAGPHEKVEGDDGHVGTGCNQGSGVGGGLGVANGDLEEANRDRFYPSAGRVHTTVAAQLP